MGQNVVKLPQSTPKMFLMQSIPIWSMTEKGANVTYPVK